MIDRISELGLPARGEQFRLVTQRAFNAVEILEFIALDSQIMDLKLAAYSISFDAAKKLKRMIDEHRIEKAEILMSNLRNKNYREKEEIVKKMFSGEDRISLFFCSSHAKVMAARTIAGDFYVVEGSGNLASGSRVEQYVIDNDQDVFDFVGQWMARIKYFLAGKKELEVC